MKQLKPLIIILFCFFNNLFPNKAKITVTPNKLVCGSYQTIEIKFSTHNLRISSGGGFRFELPMGYLETKPYYWDKPQIDIIEGKGFVSVDEKNKNYIKISLSGARGGIINCQFLKNVNPHDTVRIFYSGTVQSLAWESRINAQWPINKKKAHADIIIDNTGIHESWIPTVKLLF